MSKTQKVELKLPSVGCETGSLKSYVSKDKLVSSKTFFQIETATVARVDDKYFTFVEKRPEVVIFFFVGENFRKVRKVGVKSSLDWYRYSEKNLRDDINISKPEN